MTKVLQTTRYSKFKNIRGNRNINKKYLNVLARSIKEDNMLPENPIIVNSRMEVLDGQHRLLAAEMLGIPIYYVISKTGGIQNVQMLNTNVRSWTTQDFLNSYIERGFDEYIFLQDFCEENNISISVALWLLTGAKGRQSNQTLKEFREGDFRPTHKEQAAQFLDHVKELDKYILEGAEYDRDFLRALHKVYRAGISQKELVAKFEESGLKIGRHSRVRDYLRAFEDVVSFRKKTPVRIY